MLHIVDLPVRDAHQSFDVHLASPSPLPASDLACQVHSPVFAYRRFCRLEDWVRLSVSQGSSPVKKSPTSQPLCNTDCSRPFDQQSRLQSLFTAPSTPSPNTIPTPRNPYPSLNHTLLHSCVSLSLSSPTLSSFDLPPSDSISSSCARSRTSATLVAARGRGGISLPSPGGSSEAAETPSRPSRVRAMTTLGRGSQRAGAREERRSPVLEGLEDVMRMAQEVMVETE